MTLIFTEGHCWLEGLWALGSENKRPTAESRWWALPLHLPLSNLSIRCSHDGLSSYSPPSPPLFTKHTPSHAFFSFLFFSLPKRMCVVVGIIEVMTRTPSRAFFSSLLFWNRVFAPQIREDKLKGTESAPITHQPPLSHFFTCNKLASPPMKTIASPALFVLSLSFLLFHSFHFSGKHIYASLSLSLFFRSSLVFFLALTMIYDFFFFGHFFH